VLLTALTTQGAKMSRKIFITVLAITVLTGCVRSAGIEPDGADSYRIMAAGDTGFSSSASMQMKNHKKATEFCAAKGLVIETLAEESQQAHALGGFPEATLRFRCVSRQP
jgi:hypothetical protein